MSGYAPMPAELPDDVSHRNKETIYRCSNCGVDNVLHWHAKLIGAAACSRPECGKALNTMAVRVTKIGGAT